MSLLFDGQVVAGVFDESWVRGVEQGETVRSIGSPAETPCGKSAPNDDTAPRHDLPAMRDE